MSRFAVSRGRSVKASCACGSHKFTIGARHGQVWLQVPCYLCDGVHYYYFSPKGFWAADLRELSCAESDVQVGCYGRDEQVERHLRSGGSELDRLLEDAAFDEYFDDPEVMYQALHRVHTLAEEGNLRCRCGNRNIAVDIYPERLDLSCPSCGERKSLLAGSTDDLATLERLRSIEVGEDAGRRSGKGT